MAPTGNSLSVDRFGGLHRVLDAMDAYPFDAELMEVALAANAQTLMLSFASAAAFAVALGG